MVSSFVPEEYNSKLQSADSSSIQAIKSNCKRLFHEFIANLTMLVLKDKDAPKVDKSVIRLNILNYKSAHKNYQVCEKEVASRYFTKCELKFEGENAIVRPEDTERVDGVNDYKNSVDQ